MAYQEILYDVAERIATITLNRPERLNVFTRTIDWELREAMTEATADEAVRSRRTWAGPTLRSKKRSAIPMPRSMH